MTLQGTVIAVPDLDAGTVAAMLALMQAHYLQVEPATFQRDLAAKQWVILLREGTDGPVRGFSTQQWSRHTASEHDCNILFSGDTVIDRDYWGGLVLPVCFGSLLSTLLCRDPGRELYWMLISKGYRTYRFLPVFYREFFPAFDRATPPSIARLMHSLGADRFGASYDPATGTIRAGAGAQRLRTELGLPPAGRKPDPAIQFFFECNPGWERGDELLCLTRFHPTNLKPFIRRALRNDLRLDPVASVPGMAVAVPAAPELRTEAHA